MEGKKMAPPPHQHPPRPHQPHPPPNHAENHYTDSPQYTQAMQQPHHNQPNTVIHQPPTRPQQPQSIGPRSPLLENHQDLYGTRQPTELARQYALREQQLASHQRLEHQQRTAPMTNSLYSPQSPSQDPILTAPVPPGYNASVHQAYLRRNQHQLGDHQQIYQNHQSIYQPANQQPRIYQPYTSRIQQPNYMTSGHSHTQLLRQQYNELQQMKLQQQMQYQSQAQIQQQQTFAQRQILHQHLHSRQQSQQNLSQYGTSPSTAQLNEVNARLIKKQDNMITPDDYANHPSNKTILNQTKQSSVSPVSKTSGPLSDPLSSPSTKSPSGSESRRSSSGTSQALRSPIAQRPTSSPVTKAGWLYKQGSDGLKVWRKRWFVLSEYCLFYYKGQEEDKLLGSVLLPSYVVSACSGDEKGLRKWSFKCEHANMRTYILAAPDQNSMEQWVRVLTMAATMQDGSLIEKVQHPTGNQPSSNNKERRSKTPINSAQQDDNVPETSGGIQHMYENAPPKPRRSNEGYQSPSPERVDRYDPNYDILREPSAYSSADSAQPKHMKNRMSTKSPVHTNAEAIYESKSASSNYATQRNLTKSPEAIYNAHNLSLPLTNTNNRLENNKSPLNFPNNMPNRVIHSNENRLSQNKSPAYFNSKNETQDNVPQQSYHADSQNIYVESGYQKMLQQQEMNKRMMEREQYNQEQGAMQRQHHNMNRTGTNGPSVERQSFERRTPDTYGRSMIVPGYYSKGRSGDYEDVYNNPSHSQNYGEQSYRRPMSPVAYEEKNTTSVQLPHQRYAQTNLDTNQIYQAPPVQMRQKKLPHNAPVNNNIPRPHSADFLEYEAKNPSYDPNVPARHTNPTSRQPPRPKSSLDINTHNDYNGDNYYYSEASYAEKMRQSAHYLRNKNFGSTVFNPRQSDPKSPEYVKERKMSMPSFRGDEGNIGNYDAEMRIDRESIYGARDQNRNVSGSDKYGHSEVTGPNSNWTLRNKSLSQIMTQDDVYNRSNSAMSEGSTVSGFNRESQMGHGSGDQFMRSASARLPSTGSDQLSSRDGERKVQQREESMKRLLEWKQRMLQSPLTRKPTPATLSLARSLPPGPSQRQTLPKVSTRLHNQIQPSYNSYSSDDEERLGEVVGAAGDTASQPGQGQAGRSITPSPPSSPLPRPPLELQPRSQPAESSSNSDSRMPDLGNLRSRHRSDESPSSTTGITAPSLSTVIDIPQSPEDSDAESESEMQLEYTDNDLDEILAQSDENEDTQDDSTNGRKSVMRCFPKGNERELTSNFERESISQRFPDYEICEVNENITNSNSKDGDINIVKIRSKASTPKPETPPNEEEFEDHYLPMSPRKAVLDTEPAHTEIIKNISVFGSVQHHEDNPYVEMSQGIGVESAFLNEEMQAYEVVCVSSGKVEPVYMELNHMPDKNVLDDKSSNSTFADMSSTSKEIKSSVKNIPPPKSILRKQISESKLSVKSASRMDVKSPLPDILLNSQGKNSSSKSDSSDADDEGSKDFPLGAAFSRFSISDSFRPASYYLGTSGILTETQDSSDSELVSPPPIPTSPPPMEELDLSLAHYSHRTKSEDNVDGNDESGRKISTEKKSTLMVYGNTPSMYDTIFKGERIKRNRASMPDNERKLKEAKNADANKRSSLDSKFIPPTYRTSGNTDTDSLLSYNADRGSSRMSLESDFSTKFDMSVSGSAVNLGDRQNVNLLSEKNSIHDGEEEFVELRHVHHPTDNEIERMLKRRPLSEESCIEIESLDSNFNENIEDVNLDQYLDELQASDVYLYANTMYPGMKSPSNYFQDSRPLDMATVGYLNDRVAAIREEVQYENIHLIEKGMDRSRSRNSLMSNTISDPDTVNTMRPTSGMSNTSGMSGSVSSLHVKSSLSVRSASRNSLPTESNLNTSSYNPINHTRHASYEQPTISYYTKNTSYFENDASILKNLNQSLPHDHSNKVNISEMNKAKSSKTPDSQIVQPKSSQPVISHSRDSSLEQSAPYYYSDLSSQDNLNVTTSASPYPPSFNKNNFIFNSKLNNQRRKGPLGKKCDISHIHNPIHSNSNYNQLMEPGEGPIQIAAAARCVSVEFLSAADKFTDIDNKNIYESDTLKKKKVRDSMPSLHSSLSSKNIYLSSHDKSNSTDVNMTLFGQHFEESRNKSLERILNQTVHSGNSSDTRPRSDMSRSRSQSALSEAIDSQNQPSVSNRLSEFPEMHSSPNVQFNRKPVNNNLYVEVGSSASNSENCRVGDTGDMRCEDGNTCDGEMMWDEDSLWTENLRRVSQRHARSLDHLDCLVSPTGTSGRRSVDLKTMLKSSDGTLESESKSRSGRISREVKYVNDNVKSQRPLSSKRRPYKKNAKKPLLKLVMIDQSNENDVYVQLASESVKTETVDNVDDGVYEQLATDSQKVTKESQVDVKESEACEAESKGCEVRKRFEIDREKLRQWDLMSSGEGCGGEGEVASTTPATTASMSASITGVENSIGKRQPLVGGGSSNRGAPIPVRAVSPRVRPSVDQIVWSGNDPDSLWAGQIVSQTMNTEEGWSTSRSPSRQSTNQPIRAVSPRVRRASDVDERPPPIPLSPPPESPTGLQTLPGAVPDLSAGELLGRTHEELVLLLIQLRRRQSATASAIEQCCTQIHSVQTRLSTDETSEHRHENLQRLEQLRRHLSDLERHYTKSKPLVHLVDNMVKLGALYNRGPTTLDRLEQSQLFRERALLEQAQEQRRWAESSESLSREQVEQRVEQLRAMERSVAGEAQTLRGLRREREALQRALGGAHLQQDLSRVHAMLAINSKKLEQTVAGNARLEQELSVLRQKLQGQHLHQLSKGDPLTNNDGTDARTAADTTALLEDELKRVQHLVGDLQKQRQELSIAVRQLTDKSQSLGLVSSNSNIHAASQNDFSNDPSNSQANKKRFNPHWVETDLDDEAPEHGSCSPTGRSMAPLYIDIHSTEQRASSPDQNDDLGLNSAFANLSSVEKQEIKTVRIVKRESERRQRDRERSSLQPGNSEWSAHQAVGTLDQLLEEDNMAQYSSRSTSLPRGFQTNQPQYTYNPNTSYQQDNQPIPRQYLYPKDNTPVYQHRSQHANPPNTLSLTNVNNPFDNMSISSASINNMFVSSPSLINNNDYSNNRQDMMQMSHSKYGYQKSAQILPLPVTSNNYCLSKHSMSHSVPYNMEGSSADMSRSSLHYTNGPISPGMSKTASITSLTKGNAELSPVFTSEAARQIIIEMAGEKNGVVKSNGSQHRRQVPKEKRRHYTAPHHLSAKALDQTNGDDFFYQEKWYRARDDVDMERVLRGGAKSSRGPPPLAAPPDVVRSTLPAPHTDHYSEHTIDRLLAAPNKILIPERYIPEQAPELSPEEQKKRMEKVESIKKMLSSTTPSGDPNKSPDDNDKRQREHLLQLNQILAKQVMEMSKIVAVKALQTQPLEGESSYDSEDLSPEVELPLYQQRDNFFT